MGRARVIRIVVDTVVVCSSSSSSIKVPVFWLIFIILLFYILLFDPFLRVLIKSRKKFFVRFIHSFFSRQTSKTVRAPALFFHPGVYVYDHTARPGGMTIAVVIADRVTVAVVPFTLPLSPLSFRSAGRRPLRLERQRRRTDDVRR